MKLVVKQYSAQIDDEVTAEMKVMQEFMIHALNNLHASNHVHSCFKKGYREYNIHEAFSDPVPPWWHFDIFMNWYHNHLSEILGSNTNVQCGIDGGHMMYATYYTSKGTQAEDKLMYCQVAKTCSSPTNASTPTAPPMQVPN